MPNALRLSLYKDVFLTNVLKREDGLANFWKERFIAGLPKLFGERILSKLRQNFATNDIPFNLPTFGQLFGVIKSEGLNLCNELKLQAKYGDKSNTRNEMGNFCEAFGIEKMEGAAGSECCIPLITPNKMEGAAGSEWIIFLKTQIILLDNESNYL